MKRVEVIPHRHWLHRRTGTTASIYGAVPYTNDKDDWEVVEKGWTWQHTNGTVGLGRCPCATRAEAEAVAHRINSR